MEKREKFSMTKFICNYCRESVAVILSHSGGCPSCTEVLEEMSEQFYEEGYEEVPMHFFECLGE